MAMGMAVDTAQQQPYDLVAALTRYLNHYNKSTIQEQKEKLSPEGHNTLRSKSNAVRVTAGSRQWYKGSKIQENPMY
jgi:hypothetical protein